MILLDTVQTNPNDTLLAEIEERIRNLRRDKSISYAQAKATLKYYVARLGVSSLVNPKYAPYINGLGEAVGEIRERSRRL